MKTIRAFLLAVVAALCLAACVSDNPEMVKTLTNAGFTHVQQLTRTYQFTGRIGQCRVDFVAGSDGNWSYTTVVAGSSFTNQLPLTYTGFRSTEAAANNPIPSTTRPPPTAQSSPLPEGAGFDFY